MDIFEELFDLDYETCRKLKSVIREHCGPGNDDRDRAEIGKFAFEIYQYLRREYSWKSDGKDWRVDKRQWPEMMSVSYDYPLRRTSEPIATERE